jgi:fatty-acyl-CoA synthase
MNVSWISHSVLDALPTGDPEAVALSIGGQREWTYEQLALKSEAYARALSAKGVRKGDRVGLLLQNILEYFALYFAVGRLGAIAVRLNWRLAPPELEYALNDSGCKLLCLQTSFVDKIEPIIGDVAVETYVAFESSAELPAPSWTVPGSCLDSVAGTLPEVDAGLDDVLMLMYTSGTTGRPKGAIWTHGNTLWHASMQAMKFGFTSDTVALTTGPFYHAGAFEVVLMPALLCRGTAVGMPSGDFTIEKLIDVIERSRVTHALLYPFMLYELLRHERCTPEVLRSLKTIETGGDPVMPWVLDTLTRRLPGVELVPTYGLTEGGGNTTFLDFADIRKHRTSVGRPLPLTRVKIDSGDGTPAAPDVVGEILVSSPSVAQGYWEKPEETRATFVKGWCRTGDLGSIDADGYLTITGRKKDMIRSGGENIYPAEVESVLTDHPAIADAALVAVPNDRYIEVGCAVIVLEPGAQLSDEELNRYSRKQLAGYKRPRYWVRVEALPRNAAGKVLKTELRSRYSDLGRLPEIAEGHE